MKREQGLIQFFLRRPDFVKLLVFSDKAGALCGRLLKGQLCIEEEIGIFGLQISCCHPAILWLNFNADTLPACSEGSDQCRASPTKGVKHGVACKRKHADETGRQFHWKRGGMLLSGCSGDIPDLLKPLIELSLGYLACFALFLRRLPVSSGLALHEDELHVVLDDGVGFIRLTQELRPVCHFIRRVSDFMPDDRIQVVKAHSPANDTNVSVKGKYKVSSKIASGHADIADHTHQPSTGDKDTKGMSPSLFQFTQKCLVILDMPQLIGILLISLEVPVRRRSDDEVEGFIIQEGQIPCIAIDKPVRGRQHILS